MANIVLSLGKDIEVGASDLLKLLIKGNALVQKDGTAVINAAPAVLAGFGVLAQGIEKCLAVVEGAATDPLGAILNGPEEVQYFIAVWPELKAFLATIKVKV